MRWVVVALCYSGLLALCLAMPKHYKHVWQRERSIVRQILQGLGWLSLCLAFGVSVCASGWSFGPVEWVGMLAVTGVTLIALFSYAPHWTAAGGAVMFLAACASLLM